MAFGSDGLGYLCGEGPVAAADVQDAFAWLGIEVGDDGRGKLWYE